MMKVILEAVAGPAKGRKIEVNEGTFLRIGRTEKSDLAMPEDGFLSGLHFAVGCDGKHCLIRDMGSSNGTYVNGAKVIEAALTERDQIVAGGTTFAIQFEQTQESVEAGEDLGRTMSAPAFRPGVTPAAPPAPATQKFVADRWPAYTAPQKRLLDTLFRDNDAVYAVLDPMRDSRIPATLVSAGDQYCSLYDGQLEVDPQTAPFLVLLTPVSRVLETLVKDGWGASWGVYVTSPAHPEQVRAHLRDYLVLRTETGKGLCLPFYNPLLLRVLMERGSPRECTRFFGPLTRFVIEAEHPSSACELQDTGQGVAKRIIRLEESEAVPA